MSGNDSECTCPYTDPSMWTTYGDATEPGSMQEWDPDCPAHPATPPADDASECEDGVFGSQDIANALGGRGPDDASTDACEPLTEAERQALRDSWEMGPLVALDVVQSIVATREAAARAEERERIAQAIEEAGRRKPRDPQWMWAADAAVAARIARGDS